MATEGWITIPGVGKRYRTSSGEIRNSPPTFLTPVRNFLGGIGPGIADFFSTQAQADALKYRPQATRERLNSIQTGKYGPSDWQIPRSKPLDSVPIVSGLANGIQTGKYGPSDWQIPGWKPSGSVPIVSGLASGGRIDRRQSDQYRAAIGQQAPAYPSFPLTPQGQLERYFSSGSPEMDRYFGAASRGAGAPRTLEEMNALAVMSKAPLTAPLSTYYRAQSAAGRGNMDTIATALTQGLTEKEAENMAAWARANPMLADRLYNKKFPGGFSAQAPATTGAIPTPGLAATEPTFVGAPQGFDFNLNPPAAVPGTQGQNPTDAVKYLQQAYTRPEPTAPEKVAEMLNKWGVGLGQRGTIIGN